MIRLIARTLLIAVPFGCLLTAQTVDLVNTIPSGDLWLQPPLAVFGGNLQAYGFVSPADATLDQISVAVQYLDLSFWGYTGRSAMEIGLYVGDTNLPRALLEGWTVQISPAQTTLGLVTFDSITHVEMLAGQQYWVAGGPLGSDTAIGWGLASAGYPGVQLPVAYSSIADTMWQGAGTNLATEFRITGTQVLAAPEPSEIWPAATFLIALVLLRLKPGLPA